MSDKGNENEHVRDHDSGIGIWNELWKKTTLTLLPALIVSACPSSSTTDSHAYLSPLNFSHPFLQQFLAIIVVIHLFNIQTHYACSPTSGFWLLELGKRIIRLIAVDSTNNELIMQQSKEQLKVNIKKTGMLHIATIQHFFQSTGM